MRRVSLPRLAGLVREAPRVLLAIHEQPDADALGSALGLGAALRSRGQRVEIGSPDPVPERYRFLPGWRRIHTRVRPAPLALALDLNDPSRLGPLADAVRASAQVAVLDHHPGALEWDVWAHVRPSAAATAVLVYQLLRALRVPLTREIADCLYTGLGGDTGFFTFQNTGAEALALASRLAAAGAEPYRLHALASTRLPLPTLRLRGRALQTVQSELDGRLVYAWLRLEDFAAAGAALEETEGVVDLLKRAEGGEVFVLFKQVAPEDWRLSFRSDRKDVGRLARELGGGGHAVAAGAAVAGTEEYVRDLVLGRLRHLWEKGRR